MINQKKIENIIVGGGPAGLSTWLHLHKFNPELAAKCIVIEKEKYPRDKICGGGVGAWSEFVLDNLRINLRKNSLFISDLEFIYGEERFNLHQKNCFRMVNRSEFDHELAKNAIDRGLNLHENEKFIDFTKKNEKLIIKTNKRKYVIKVLIGADGSLSKVRKRMNLPNKTHLAPTLELFSPVNPDYDDEFDKKKIVVDLSYIEEGLQGYFWHVPCLRNGIPTIGHGVVDFKILENKQKASMKEIFKNELEKRKININQKMWLSHPIRWPSIEDIVSSQNILLVGDAIGIEPAFGGGIHFALSYGEVAAKEIDDAYQQNDFSFGGYTERLQSHLVGKFMKKCTYISHELYTKKMDPFEAAREIFTIKK